MTTESILNLSNKVRCIGKIESICKVKGKNILFILENLNGGTRIISFEIPNNNLLSAKNFRQNDYFEKIIYNPKALQVNFDGTKMYIYDSLNHYYVKLLFGTAYDISTLTTDINNDDNLMTRDGNTLLDTDKPNQEAFNNNDAIPGWTLLNSTLNTGRGQEQEFYFYDNINKKINIIELDNAGEIHEMNNSESQTNPSNKNDLTINEVNGVCVNDIADKLFMIDRSTKKLLKYNLNNSYDFGHFTLDNSFTFDNLQYPNAFAISDNGKKIYISQYKSDVFIDPKIYEYELQIPFNITNIKPVKNKIKDYIPNIISLNTNRKTIINNEMYFIPDVQLLNINELKLLSTKDIKTILSDEQIVKVYSTPKIDKMFIQTDASDDIYKKNIKIVMELLEYDLTKDYNIIKNQEIFDNEYGFAKNIYKVEFES
jgi:hypothetical protein